MSHSRYPSDEIIRRGQALYEQEIRTRVEEGNKGNFLALDIETGGYEIDVDELAAIRRAKAKNPGGALYIVRIGYPAAYRLGGGGPVARP